MRLFYITAVLHIIAIGSGFGQSPLLIESIDQQFNHDTQNWEDQFKTIYGYDQEGNMIIQNRHNLNSCNFDDPNNYCGYPESLVHQDQTWRFNDKAYETSHTDKSYEYVWKEGAGYMLSETGYFKRETKYVNDSLILEQVSTQKYNFDVEVDGYLDKTINSTINKYNNENQIIYNETTLGNYYNDQLSNLQLNRTLSEYSAGHLISQVISERSYYQEDTMEYKDISSDYTYNQQGLLTEETTTYATNYQWSEESISQSKIKHSYNPEQLLQMSEQFYFDDGTGMWLLFSTTTFDYHENKSKKSMVRKSKDGEQYRVYTIRYDEMEREIYSASEIQDENGNLLEQGGWRTSTYFDGNKDGSQADSYAGNGERTYSWMNCTEYNADKKPLAYRYSWRTYKADTLSHTSTNETHYEYDSEGFLARLEENRFIFGSDSILLIGCCGSFYDRETIFENRCDGAPTTVTIEELRYKDGTAWEIYPEPYLARQINKYSTALCESSQQELSELIVYPNPTTDKVTVDSKLLQTYGTQLDLVDLNGKLLLSEMAQISNAFQMDLSTLPPGVYVLRLSNELGSAEQKVIYYR